MTDPLRYLNALRAFEAAARLESISKAAEELHVSHSVISQHVRNLETWLGTELFKRSGNRIVLTEDCKWFFPQVSSGMQVLRDACDVLVRRSATRQIIVKAEPALATRWLRKHLIAFAQEHPSIQVELQATSRADNAKRDDADLVIHFEDRLVRGDGQINRLLPLDAFPACAPDLIKNGRPDDFTTLPMVHDNGRHIWQQWFLAHHPNDETWKTGTVHSDLALAAMAAVDGEGVVLADHIMFKRELTNGDLIPLDDRKVRVVWYAISSRDPKEANPFSEIFRTWLIDRSAKLFDPTGT